MDKGRRRPPKQRQKLSKKFVVLVFAVVLGFSIWFVSAALGLGDDDGGGTSGGGGFFGGLSPATVDINLLQIHSDHANLTYTFSYPGGALDLHRHRIVDPYYFVDLITYSPRDGVMGIKTHLPVVFDIEYQRGIVYINVISPRDIYEHIVIIDPGHGGADIGAPGPGDVRESDLVLAISLYLYNLFQTSNSGITAFMTRHDDSFVAPASRAAFANALGDVFVSVHTNTFADPSVAGTETLFNPFQNTENIRLAQIIQNRLVAELGTRDRGIIERTDLYALGTITIPAVFAEIDFKTNPEALSNLISSSYQQRVARALYEGIVYAFNN
ncbi:MAG: N-acetylmuramoyl-L-alanine amidase [Defluviitaleaceae bacterium]|nr:N-acetylmuramoyl-L-alanine amidase [Defluviitaleaceae bacterium]